MSPTEKQKLKTKIEEDISATTKDILRLEQAIKPIPPDDAIGRLTRMDAINTKSINEANLRNAKIKLSQLEKTLKQIADSEFGICVVCDEPIPIGRLMLVPESTMCVRCKEKS